MKDKRCRGCGCRVFGYDSMCFKCFQFKELEKVQLKPKQITNHKLGFVDFPKAPSERKNGDIWEIPANVSPFGAKQWGYQGSARSPYIVTRYDTKRDGAVTGDGWACGCPDFTRHTPRAHCKHILAILVKQGKAPETKAAIAGATNKELEEFKAWQRAKAESKPATGAVNITTIVEGRKFR